MDEISDVKPPKGFPHITDLTGSEATIFQVANAQGDILGYATMADIDSYIEKKVSETVHSFTKKQTFQDVTINGTFDGDSVVNKSKLTGALANYTPFINVGSDVKTIDELFTEQENQTVKVYWGKFTDSGASYSTGYVLINKTSSAYGSAEFVSDAGQFFKVKLNGVWQNWQQLATKSDLANLMTKEERGFSSVTEKLEFSISNAHLHIFYSSLYSGRGIFLFVLPQYNGLNIINNYTNGFVVEDKSSGADLKIEISLSSWNTNVQKIVHIIL